MKTQLPTISFLLLLPAVTSGVVHFNDGAYHKIDYIIDDTVRVDQDQPGLGTHIEITDTGAIAPGQGYGTVFAFNDSRVTVSGGELGWMLYGVDNSHLTINDGIIGYGLFTEGHASMTLNEGTVNTSAVAIGFSNLHITGGSIGTSIELRQHASARISGGSFEYAKIMSGGTSSGDMCLIELLGSNFSVNGNVLSIGQSVRDYAEPSIYSGINCLTGRIIGTLANGDVMNNVFYIFDDSDIVYIPEPAGLLLLGLGALLIRKQKNLIRRMET